jgi:hypothetical protein
MDGSIFIQVAVRFSPQNALKRNIYDNTINEKEQDKLGNFNFAEKDSNGKIFSEILEPEISKFLDGFDISIVKYGQKNIFYESAIAEDEDNKIQELNLEYDAGIVQKFIKTIFEELTILSKKEVQYFFNVGWTEISENNQMTDLFNGSGLLQCYTMTQLLEALSIGYANRKGQFNHNILSLILEQQSIVGPLVQHKVSTINFCDLAYGTPTIMEQPKDLPTNFYNNHQYHQPLPPPPSVLTPPTAQYYYNQANSSNVWNKLLKNAEQLFAKLNLNEMNDNEKKEIEEWLFLKNECDNFLLPPDPQFYHNQNFMSPQAPVHQPTSLLPILEMDENANDEENEANNIEDSDNASYIDIDDTNNILFEKINAKIQNFQNKTDEIVKNKYQEYFEKHPKVLSSSNSKEEVADPMKFSTSSASTSEYLAGGRRKSIRDTLNSEDLNLIRKAAAVNEFKIDEEEGDENLNNETLNKLEELRRNLKKSIATIDATKLQVKELEQTIMLKRNLITDLIENNNTRNTAKYKFGKKKSKLESEYEKCKKQLNRALVSNNKNPVEIERLKELTTTLEQRLVDLNSIHHITNESNRKVKQLHNSLQESKKQLEIFNKVLKKEVKQKDAIEKEIASLKTKKLKAIEGEVSAEPHNTSQSNSSKISDNKLKIRDVNARISHLDEILKEKASNLQQFGGGLDGEKESKEKESLRYEIRNLRRTRDHLLEQRVSLYKKLKRDKMLTYKEERKMLVCIYMYLQLDFTCYSRYVTKIKNCSGFMRVDQFLIVGSLLSPKILISPK